jgi:hypothetical protein
MSAGLPALPPSTAVSRTISSLPDDIFPNVLSFLQPDDVACFERVSRAWKLLIGSVKAAVWKNQCAMQKTLVTNQAPTTVVALSILRPTVHASDIFEHFDDNTLVLISDYAFEETFDPNNFPPKVLDIISKYAELSPKDYKAAARPIEGNIFLEPSYAYINIKAKTGLHNRPLRWGTDAPEPFVSARVYSDESLNACQNYHRPHCESREGQGSWSDIHPRIHKFPCELPLRLFMNQDGSFKMDGGTIRVKFQNKYIVLICSHPERNAPNHQSAFRTFAEKIQSRVDTSVALAASGGLSFITTKDVAQAKAKAATAIQGEWISAD